MFFHWASRRRNLPSLSSSAVTMPVLSRAALPAGSRVPAVKCSSTTARYTRAPGPPARRSCLCSAGGALAPLGSTGQCQTSVIWPWCELCFPARRVLTAGLKKSNYNLFNKKDVERITNLVSFIRANREGVKENSLAKRGDRSKSQ